jgi:histone H3/H4
MSTDDTSYAPKSPDLSSFYSSGPTDPAPQLQSPSNLGYLQPPSFGYTPGSSYTPPGINFQHQSSVPENRYQPPVFNQQHQQQQQLQQPPFDSSFSQPYGQPFGDLGHQGAPSSFADPYPPQSIPEDIKPEPEGESSMPPRKAASAAEAAPPVEVMYSPVRTKFPTARIKRIMQADEEVGKVAQQTPIAVGKALELFMVQLVGKSADVAKDKGSKRVTAAMLKQVVETDDQWDFLRDIVSRVENDKETSKAKPKPESESDEEVVEKKKTTRGKRKKV